MHSPLGATFLDSEATKNGVPRVCLNNEINIRDPARDLVDRKAVLRKVPPKLSRNPADPLDDVPLPPNSGPTTGYTPGRGRLSKLPDKNQERNVKRLRDEEDSDDDDANSSAKKPHLDLSSHSASASSMRGHLFSPPSAPGADLAPESESGSMPQNLLQIVENTLAQIRGGASSRQSTENDEGSVESASVKKS